MVVLGFVISLLEAHVILSIASLYTLDFVSRFSFVQVFGIILVFGIIKYTYKKEDSEDVDFSQKMKDSAVRLMTNLLVLLVSWGLAFVSYWVLS